MRQLASREDTVAVTGATGWFGRETLDLLAQALGPDGFRARVTPYASREREVVVAGVGTVLAQPLAALTGADLLIHHAFRTERSVGPEALDAYVRANVEIATRVLDVVRTGAVCGVLLTSSGAAARPADLAANPYGTLKALDELAFAEACRRAGATLVAPRVHAAAGPHLSGAYALGDLIGRAQAGRPLELRARGRVVRSYVGVRELLVICLGELLDGRDAAFDAGGEDEVEVEELAEVVRRVLGREDLPILRERDPSVPDDVYVGDPAALRALAARHEVVLRDLPALVAATAAGSQG